MMRSRAVGDEITCCRSHVISIGAPRRLFNHAHITHAAGPSLSGGGGSAWRSRELSRREPRPSLRGNRRLKTSPAVITSHESATTRRWMKMAVCVAPRPLHPAPPANPCLSVARHHGISSQQLSLCHPAHTHSFRWGAVLRSSATTSGVETPTAHH
jgi:hypothetical protein